LIWLRNLHVQELPRPLSYLLNVVRKLDGIECFTGLRYN
jgi:hypothetical protein